MVFPLKFTVFTALLLLAACRSDPIQFHTLTPTQVGNHSTTTVGVIQIETISLPPQVDRAQIVIREGNSTLAILESHWWGATLVEELRSALADQLSNSPVKGKYSVRVDVQRFDSVPGQYALMDVIWRLRSAEPDNKAQVICRSTLQTPSGASVDELVLAQQNNIKRLAALISQAATRPQASCPSS
ncbi:PqiC family protein [Pseudomonas laurylsulfatiphila]|uniref:PqiC family protein n=1 Tax=Pseudomonas laurylsulfatiphila TaxID=2011015 RepID=UPI00215EAE15|nr:PqiC family protein [Pseudomonas laurylsulfatiphila]UVM02593.1 PqiC family protein [Pseudomonas laurylsulfatiphila]